MSNESLTGGSIRISVDKPSCSGVIIAGLEVIEAAFGWGLLCTPEGRNPLRDYAFSGGYLMKQNVVYRQATPPGYHGACQEYS
mgnify:CR=1 FL=1